MKITTELHADRAHLLLEGRFDYTAHKAFGDAYDPLLRNAELHALEIDMQNVDYLDSAALGMLLLLKERAVALQKHVVLARCPPVVSHVLRIAQFHQLFTII